MKLSRSIYSFLEFEFWDLKDHKLIPDLFAVNLLPIVLQAVELLSRMILLLVPVSA
jgi:hypothetical protein